MKHKLTFTPTEHFAAVMTLRHYIKWLHRAPSKKGFVPYYKMVCDKLMLTTNPALDGGEMRAIVDALRSDADHSFLLNRGIDQEFLIEFSNKIDEERQIFQYTHGPKIKKAASSRLTAI